MHNFKKVLISLLSILLIFTLLSLAVIEPFLYSEHGYYQDSKFRKNLAGTIDFLVIGASNSLNAYQPVYLDQSLDCNSYNLSASMMTLNDRAYFLKKELDRNPVDTVVLDLSHDTLTRDESNEYAICEGVSYARLDSVEEHFFYLTHYVRFDDWLNLYSREFVSGLEYWMQRILGRNINNVDYNAKGFSGKIAADLSLDKQTAREEHDLLKYQSSFRKDNIQEFQELIMLCQDYDVRVIVAVAPVPDSVIWHTYDWDAFYEWAEDFCNKNDCEFYDMNLLRNRYELFNDQESFADVTHMSAEGSQIYTQEFSRIIDLAKTEDVTQYFYNSYEEMKADSPYMKYLEQE